VSSSPLIAVEKTKPFVGCKPVRVRIAFVERLSEMSVNEQLERFFISGKMDV